MCIKNDLFNCFSILSTLDAEHQHPHDHTELNSTELSSMICLKISCTLQPWEWDSSLWQLWILMPKLNWWSRSQKSTESSKMQAQKDTGQIMTQHVPILNASTSTDYWIYWRCWTVNSESHTHQNKQQLHSVGQATVLQHRVTDTPCHAAPNEFAFILQVQQKSSCTIMKPKSDSYKSSSATRVILSKNSEFRVMQNSEQIYINTKVVSATRVVQLQE